MRYPEFKLETYLAAREFTAPFNLCASDLESHTMQEIIQMTDQETFSLWNELGLGYTETQGHPLLREEISNEYSTSVGKDQILCFAGAEEGIYCMAHTLLDSKDHAIVVTPCYQSLEALPKMICSTTAVQLHFRNSWNLDLGLIESAIQPNTKLILINFPHNPTGTMISRATQKALVDLARKHDMWIFSDEVYRLLETEQTYRLPAIASLYEKGISLSVMSKAYGLAGLRIGWIACQSSELLRKMNETKHYLSICNSAPSEILALMALKSQDKIHERNRHLMLENLNQLDLFFEENADWFEWVRPKGGCIGYPLFKGDVSITQLADDLLQQFGVLLLPGSIYEDKQNFFRISFGRKSMPQALDQFSQFINKNKIKWRT